MLPASSIRYRSVRTTPRTGQTPKPSVSRGRRLTESPSPRATRVFARPPDWCERGGVPALAAARQGSYPGRDRQPAGAAWRSGPRRSRKLPGRIGLPALIHGDCHGRFACHRGQPCRWRWKGDPASARGSSRIGCSRRRYLICQSSSLGHARDIAAGAAVRHDLVVAVGGDGMAGAVASAVAQAAC